ncbi:MAG: hypothetical protein AMXMBFR58_20540 [Phycisphaerae bacterium]
MKPAASTPRSSATSLSALLRNPVWQVVIALVGSVLLYWVGIGSAGFSGTEGHRAIPAYHMLDEGEWLVPHLFGRPYLRKPPGMPWAIAGASELLGRTEFAARSVSALAATLSVMVSLWFGRRWFGPWGGLYAGMGQLLMPVFWLTSRSADIESLHNLGVQIAGLVLVDRAIDRRSGGVVPSIGAALAIAGGLFVAGITKGPSGAAALGACLVTPLLMARSVRPLLKPAILGGILVGGAALTIVFWQIVQRGQELGAHTVTQTVDEFLWATDQWWRVLLLGPTSLVMALPASLAMLYPWGPDAIAEDRQSIAVRHPLALPAARSLTLAVLLALGVLTVAGVSNPRYTMPAQILIAPIAGYFGLGMHGAFILKRPGIARVMMLGHPAVLVIGLAVAAAVALPMSEARRERVSGEAAGAEIAACVPEGARIISDHLVEARPDVLWYASAAGSAGERRVVWLPLAKGPFELTHGDYLVLRDDALTGELESLARGPLPWTLQEVGNGSVYRFSFRVMRVLADQAVAGQPLEGGSP